jgi:hypothetical protein
MEKKHKGKMNKNESKKQTGSIKTKKKTSENLKTLKKHVTDKPKSTLH